jgi:hypothetical protein
MHRNIESACAVRGAAACDDGCVGGHHLSSRAIGPCVGAFHESESESESESEPESESQPDANRTGFLSPQPMPMHAAPGSEMLERSVTRYLYPVSVTRYLYPVH